ncbi:MAG TPA: hypothetical protein VMT17_06295 [Anaeromyxobacteraceae bacterium]|nr:hypothetical protein [Anaeromyxobacteraceae bacterium]
MRFRLQVTFVDLNDSRPDVAEKFFEAASEEDGRQVAYKLMEDSRALAEVAVPFWRIQDQWKDLDGVGLLKVAEYALGYVELWCDERLLEREEVEFDPCDVDWDHGQFGSPYIPVTAPPPPVAAPQNIAAPSTPPRVSVYYPPAPPSPPLPPGFPLPGGGKAT